MPFPTVSPFAPDVQASIAMSLQPAVSSLHGLYAAAKVAHWNVRGPNFVGLHDLFGKVAAAAAEHEDAVAELIPQMGAMVEPPGEMPAVDGAPDGDALCKSLAGIMAETIHVLTDAADQANDAGDLDTVQALSEATTALKKLGWQVAAHVTAEETPDEEAVPPAPAEGRQGPRASVRPEGAQ
jgi:starvation-inducible DNA-binding protein